MLHGDEPDPGISMNIRFLRERKQYMGMALIAALKMYTMVHCIKYTWGVY